MSRTGTASYEGTLDRSNRGCLLCEPNALLRSTGGAASLLGEAAQPRAQGPGAGSAPGEIPSTSCLAQGSLVLVLVPVVIIVPEEAILSLGRLALMLLPLVPVGTFAY